MSSSGKNGFKEAVTVRLLEKNPSFDYSSDVESWTYTWIARVGHGANTQDLEVVFTIDSRVPRSVSNIEVYPYSSYYVAGSDEAQQGALLANEQTVNYLNVASGSKAKVYYQIPDSWRGAVDGIRRFFHCADTRPHKFGHKGH